jgi:hypothetical protein
MKVLQLKQQYYFTEGNTGNDNEPILFGDDGTNCTRLGGFDNYHFDNECNILSLKVLDGVKIDCKIADATSPDWGMNCMRVVVIQWKWRKPVFRRR